MKKSLLMMSLLASIALPAAAAENFYVLGDVGQGKFEADIGGGYNISKTDTTYSLGGGYNINKNFSVELAYRDLGEVKSSDIDYSSKVSATAVEASVVGKYPISDVVDVYGRVGFGRISIDQNEYDSSVNPTVHTSSSEDKTKMLVGVGASYAVNDNFAIRAEYSQFAKIDDTTLSAVSIGATYHF